MLAFDIIAAGVGSCTTSDFKWEDIAVNRNIAGVGEGIEAWQTFTLAFLNIQAIVVNPFVHKSNVVSNESIVSGTHTGPMQILVTVIQAMGKAVKMRTCHIVEFGGDKVKSIREYFDMMTVLQQLGLAG